jgi:hypothetical protein
MDISLGGTSGLSGEQLRMVFVGGTLYLSFPQIPAPQAGKPWVSESLASAGPIFPGNSDPAAVLGMLGSEGNHVVDLGPTTVDGTAVTAYRVTVTLAALRAEMSRTNLPAGLARTAEGALGTSSTVVTAYVDGANGSLRRVAADLHLTVGKKTLAASITEDFTHYGAPVSITAPPAGEVVPLGPPQPQASAQTTPAQVST